jgi:hypothetical protein
MIDGNIIPTVINKVKRLIGSAVDLVERSRTGRALVASVRSAARSMGQTLHQLWLEVTGFTFLAMAGFGAMAGIREYGRYQTGHSPGPARFILALCFTASFAWFGLSSFWKVSRKKLRAKN